MVTMFLCPPALSKCETTFASLSISDLVIPEVHRIVFLANTLTWWSRALRKGRKAPVIPGLFGWKTICSLISGSIAIHGSATSYTSPNPPEPIGIRHVIRGLPPLTHAYSALIVGASTLYQHNGVGRWWILMSNLSFSASGSVFRLTEPRSN